MKQVQDMVERLWDFVDKLDIDTLGTFLADNMVGSVVAFSLLLWVPLSILVHCVVGPSDGVLRVLSCGHSLITVHPVLPGPEPGPTV